MSNPSPEHHIYRLIVLMGVIFYQFLEIWAKVKKLSEIKPSLSTHPNEMTALHSLMLKHLNMALGQTLEVSKIEASTDCKFVIAKI